MPQPLPTVSFEKVQMGSVAKSSSLGAGAQSGPGHGSVADQWGWMVLTSQEGEGAWSPAGCDCA